MESNELKKAIRFIDKIYCELYQSEIVLRGNKNVNEKYENIHSFIQKLEDINKRPFLREYVKRILYNIYLIKLDDLSDDFIYQKFCFLKNNWTPSLLLSFKLQYYNKIVLDQKYSLDVWINFFFSKEMDAIPMWAKYWAFQGMVRLGTYNSSTGKFNRRQKNNTCIFADLNKEALLLSIKYVTRMVNNQSIYDKELEGLLKTGSFKHIYEYFLLKSREYFTETDEGKWIKYPQGCDPLEVILPLQGYNTNWCITGYGSAARQLYNGDLHIYYSKNSTGEYRMPRLAIYMENGTVIREICGVAPGQNIEEGFESVIEEKMKEFPIDTLFSNRLMQVDYLSYLHRKSYQEDFNKQELIFLYEINSNISGLVPKRDPRIKEIISNRDIRHDLSIIFECQEEEIAMGQDELLDNPKQIICLYGDLKIDSLSVSFPRLRFVHGDIICPNIKDVYGFCNLERLTGSIICDSLIDASGFYKLKSIGLDVEFPVLQYSIGLDSVVSIGRHAYLPSLIECDNLVNCQSIGENAFYPNLAEVYFPSVRELPKKLKIHH